VASSEPQSPQREWILIGIAECCATRGLERTSVEDVCDAAGVSREAFGREFAGLDECLGAAMENLVADVWRALDGIASAERPWAAALRDGTAALLATLAERPALARLALVEARGAGGRAAALRDSARAALLDFLERGRELAEPGVPASAARGALAGAEALVERRVLAGEAAPLAELAPAVAYMLAVPFTGIGEAQRLAGSAARRRHLRAVA
jgi:AcrR family transcriptional regulator